MPSPASRSLEVKALRVALPAVMFFVGTVWANAQAVPSSSTPPSGVDLPIASTPNPFAGRFSDVVLRTHEGRNARFYEDLLKGKVVLINFMYANCKGR